jgi:tryptophanyl-tRNA synthetase
MRSNKKIIFSGIQPSGNLHIGNYVGAIRQWVALQKKTTTIKEELKVVKKNSDLIDGGSIVDLSKLQSELVEDELIFCVVDLHAITINQNPKILREKNLEVAALYIACGIDPEESHIFIQSENPDHVFLSWIFDCVTPFGWMNRMTQFKDKSEKQKESTSVGLFNYPALMAADILLYDTDLVPVGNDQIQHIELTSDIAQRFNHLFKEQIFKEPKPLIDKNAARIMSLQDPLKKMSKSDSNPLATINLLDDPDEVAKKIRRAVTDSGNEIIYNQKERPAISNLLNIYSRFSGASIPELEMKFKNISYSSFKEELIGVIMSEIVGVGIKDIQKEYHRLIKNKDYLNKVLDEGRDFARDLSSKKITEVRRVMGLGRQS